MYNPYAPNPYIMQQQQPDIGGLSLFSKTLDNNKLLKMLHLHSKIS